MGSNTSKDEETAPLLPEDGVNYLPTSVYRAPNVRVKDRFDLAPKSAEMHFEPAIDKVFFFIILFHTYLST